MLLEVRENMNLTVNVKTSQWFTLTEGGKNEDTIAKVGYAKFFSSETAENIRTEGFS